MLGIVVPSASAAVSPSGQPKVVIIVGATHGATAGYRADADRAYAEAIKYTSDVTKVYSPNATWAKVKAAVVGASVVIYMGHGNGWPSPYTYDPNYTTKDGFGLNATAGNGDYNNKYYGEPYVAKLDLAPGAIILLHHLCYASGNSEPGDAEPSLSVARKRADNYAAGFLKAGAAAVIADGHSGAEPYLRALFTTHQTLESMWRTMPDQNGHVTTFASSRTPGATVFQDPNTPTTGYYRSLAVSSTSVTTDEVVSGGIGNTSGDPAELQVPGNAAVATDGAALFSEAGASEPDGSLPAGTRLRVVDTAVNATGEGGTFAQVEGIDDPSINGFVAETDLTPRDSTAPAIRFLDPGGPFSPDGDGQVDTAAIRARFTESVAWTLQVEDDHGVVFQQTGNGSAVGVAWDGLVKGVPVADGAYRVRLTGTDAWDNGPVETTGTVRVDTVAPTLTSLTPGASTTQWFSPNGDGSRDSVTVVATDPEPGAVAVKVRDADGKVVDKWTVTYGSSPVSLTWDGRTTAGGYAPDGAYTINAAPQDVAGNTGPTVARDVQVIAALRSVASSRKMFFPQDLDRLARTTRLSFYLQRRDDGQLGHPRCDRRDGRHALGRRRTPGRWSELDVRWSSHRWLDAAAGPLHSPGRGDRWHADGEPGRPLRDGRIRPDTQRLHASSWPTDQRRRQVAGDPVQGPAPLRVPARAIPLERSDDQDRQAHLQGHHPAQVGWIGRAGQVQGQGHRSVRRQATDLVHVQAALTRGSIRTTPDQS